MQIAGLSINISNMETLNTDKAKAIAEYAQASPKGKGILERLFGKKAFVKNVMEIIKTWEDVCEESDTHPVNSLPFPSPQNNHEESVNGFFKMTLIADALNEGWVPDWNNSSQYKYSPWFDHSGGVFSFLDYDFAYSGSRVGARLVFKSRELAEYAGKQFLDIYKTFHTR